MWTYKKFGAVGMMLGCIVWLSQTFETTTTIDENLDWKEEQQQEVIDNEHLDDHQRHLMDIHSQFLQPDDMQELHRLLRWRKWGNGGGGGGGGMGGLTNAEHNTIQNMVAYRGNMERTVTPIQNNGKVIGSVSITTSDDPTTAKTIKDHVLGMQKLVEAGRVTRQWDPLYAELFQHVPEYNIQIETLPKGIKVTETGSTDCAIALVQAHSSTVTKFIKNGRSEVQASHPVPSACQ